jgi:polar amino acid transport system ATP-binding protein
MNDRPVMIKASSVSKWFGSHHVLDSVSFEVRRGEVLAIIGPSGSGKSTLLRCCNGLETVSDGIIEIEGEIFADVRKGKAVKIPKDQHFIMAKKIGMVFQHFNLFPHKTVLENVIEAPMIVNGMDRKSAIIMAESILKKVGLYDRKDYYPSKISGGMKQRVAIARALGMNPDIMLFDEPTSALDPELTGEVRNVIKSLASDHMTMVIVTHEMDFARNVADRVIFMDEGRIIGNAHPDQFFEKQDHPRIRAFLQKLSDR